MAPLLELIFAMLSPHSAKLHRAALSLPLSFRGASIRTAMADGVASGPKARVGPEPPSRSKLNGASLVFGTLTGRKRPKARRFKVPD